MLAKEEVFAGLGRINRELVGRVEVLDSPQQSVLDVDSTENPIYGNQEKGATMAISGPSAVVVQSRR